MVVDVELRRILLFPCLSSKGFLELSVLGIGEIERSAPVPDVCSQYPGFSAVCPAASPFAIAWAAGKWSEESAVSTNSFRQYMPLFISAIVFRT